MVTKLIGGKVPVRLSLAETHFLSTFLLLGGNSCLTLPPSTESLCPSFREFQMIINHHRLFTLHRNWVKETIHSVNRTSELGLDVPLLLRKNTSWFPKQITSRSLFCSCTNMLSPLQLSFQGLLLLNREHPGQPLKGQAD